MEIVILIVVVCLFLFFLYRTTASSKPDKSESQIQKRRQELFEKFEKERMDQEEKEKQLSLQYGELSKIVKFPPYLKYEPMRVYASSKIVFILGEKHLFSDIAGYELIDDSSLITSSNGSTTSGAWNTVGRSIAGGLVAGSTGAIIGGVTGARRTSSVSSSTTIHDYCFYIKTTNFSNPIIKLPIRNEPDLAMELSAVLDIILSQNHEGQVN